MKLLVSNRGRPATRVALCLKPTASSTRTLPLHTKSETDASPCGKARLDLGSAPLRDRRRKRPGQERKRPATRVALCLKPTASSTRTLPLHTKSEADVSLAGRTRHLHERAIGYIVIHAAAAGTEAIAGGRACEVRCVGQVVELRAELQSQTLLDWELTRDSEVRIPHSRIPENVKAGVSKTDGGYRSECRRIIVVRPRTHAAEKGDGWEHLICRLGVGATIVERRIGRPHGERSAAVAGLSAAQ